MRFLRKDKIKKTLLVISDIHLGAGAYISGVRNFLEDFHYDQELVDFLHYYSEGEFANREVELIINGDLFDFLAVPYINKFDDEFWSEEAAIEKLDLMLNAHPEVIEAIDQFAAKKNKNIVFIIGNHDGEFALEGVRKYFLARLSSEAKKSFRIISETDAIYKPHNRISIQHGHEYEHAHYFDPKKNVVINEEGRRFFIPPWGSYYVMRVINKFKEQRHYINAVRPIRKFIINGLIYDTMLTVRFGLANGWYFFMVRGIYLFKHGLNLKKFFNLLLSELKLFQNYEELTREFFKNHPDTKVLIVGHTHEPTFQNYSDGTTFINTGTWTEMYHLDFGKSSGGSDLTFCQIDIKQNDEDNPIIGLNSWKGRNKLPFQEF